MAQLGKINRMTVVKIRDFGVYLDAGKLGEVLLPNRVVPKGCKEGDEVEAIIYLDSDDKLIASTLTPFAQVGECACLNVVSTGPVGAFLDWGLPKDLLVPFNEQQTPLKEGQSVVCFLYLDNTNRIAASSKLNRHLNKSSPKYDKHQEVDLLIADKTDLGVKAVINNRHWGLIFKDELFKPVRYGQRIKGYIKQVRGDGKIDLHLQQPGYGALDALSSQILAHLDSNQGFAPLTDKSPADEISRLFGVSKRKFKMAIGGLYKNKLIVIEDAGIRRVSDK
ncbi:S1 RNA-binding domain-containing protein [Motiliproteus sp. MSK22-1]|uniref:CvfB family protein n=1 Tax=Motiliproteus sp. MSK22-1 TaxID=1897630 RepID=UPI00097722C9|nr:S1-like domain-containing RNA-binding protein [Motiliproteus sp. MSK22-1]OMH25850.1 GntR family transcriptional regulator [Motiliproteus sp. MSK22-1]